MTKLFIDIETEALPIEQLLPIMPEFEAGANLKDPDKIAAAIKAKQEAWIESCALRATTGRVIAVASCVDDGDPEFDCTPDERTMLDVIFHHLSDAISQNTQVYAWNLFGFDLPFFCQRSSVYGVPSFKKFTTNYRGRWSWHECFVDPMQVWCGPYQRSDGASLKAVGQALGVGVKTGSGKDFAALLKNDPVAAKEYALNDVMMLRDIVDRMGI